MTSKQAVILFRFAFLCAIIIVQVGPFPRLVEFMYTSKLCK